MATFEYIPAPGAYVPKVTDTVKITNGAPTGTNTSEYFSGYVIESLRSYEIPYNVSSGAAPADRVTVTCQGPMGQAGQTSATWLISASAQTVSYWMQNTFNAAGLGIMGGGNLNYFDPLLNPTATSQTATEYILDFANRMARTGVWQLRDFYNYLLYGPPTTSTIVNTFTDTGSGGFSYKHVEFASSSRNQFNKVIVRQAAGPEQSAENAGAAVKNTWTCDTQLLNADATALSLAQYYLATMNPAVPPPTKVSCDTTSVNNSSLHTLLYQTNGTVSPLQYDFSIGCLANITLRGTTYTAMCEGLSATFYPSYMTCDFYFSPSLGQPFTLDSASLGVLDQNKLALGT